jgi:hypothetical protein
VTRLPPERKAFLYALAGTVLGGLLLAGAFALIRFLTHVDFGYILIGLLAISAVVHLLILLSGGRSAVKWADDVERRLAALESRTFGANETANERAETEANATRRGETGDREPPA